MNGELPVSTKACPASNPGRLIIRYLQENTEGASLPVIVQHLKDENVNMAADELQKSVENMLADATTLGFLERKGSRFISWVAREMCGQRRRRRSRCARRRTRRLRKRRRRRRRRRCRCS